MNTFARQDTAMPSNKVIAGVPGGVVVGNLVADLIFPMWPALEAFTFTGFPDARAFIVFAVGFALAYIVPDFANTPIVSYPEDPQPPEGEDP